MVLVSHKYRFIYIKNSKVAGSSVESFFGKFCKNPKTKYSYSDNRKQIISSYGILGSTGIYVKKNDKWYNHMNALKIRKNLGSMIFNKYIKFCVVRNPYDVIVSSYFYKKIKEPFKQYARKFKKSNLRTYSINNKSVCNYYIRYEHLKEDIIKMCEILNITNYNINSLPHHKSNYRNKKLSYKKFYDEETRKIVYKKHIKEFKLFGYTF
jgi:hypothetical protein